MPIRQLYFAAVCLVAVCYGIPAKAEQPRNNNLPQPVVVQQTQFSDYLQMEPSASDLVGNEKPVSITGNNDILPLATGGPAVLPPLPVRGSGCNLRPQLRCSGPDYCGCYPRIYYGTNPCDDDCCHDLYECANGQCGSHWYDFALRMVLRKKACAEKLNH